MIDNVRHPVITAPSSPHIIVPPTPGGDNVYTVTHGDSGREIVRCADNATALKEQARLNKQLGGP